MITSKKTSQKDSIFPSPMAALFVFFVFFAISFLTMPLTNVAYGDSDELITTAHALGLGHPPGFALFNLVLHLFQKMPTGLGVAANSHLFSVLLSSITVALVFMLTYAISILTASKKPATNMLKLSNSERLSISSLTAASLGFSFLFFLYSHVSEKYMFAVFLTTLSLFFLFLYEKYSKKNRWLYLSFIFLGLSISHLQIAITLLPAYGYYLWTYRSKEKAKTFALALALVILALILPRLLMIPMQQGASISWYFEPTLKGVWSMFFRQDFSGERYQQGKQVSAYLANISLEKSLVSLWGYTKTFISHWGVLSLIFLLFGARSSFIIKNRFTRFLLLLFIGSGVVLIAYLTYPSDLGSQAILQRQYLLSSVSAALLLGLGIQFVYYRCKRFLSVLGVKPKYLPLILIVISIPTIILSAFNVRDGNLRHYTIASELYRQALVSAPQDSVIVCFSDPSCFALLYEQEVHALRKDSIVIPLAYPLIKNSGVIDQVKRFDYGDNPHQLLDIVTWNVYQKRPVYAVDLSQYYHRYLGIENKILFFNPREFFGTIDNTSHLKPVPPIPAIYRSAAEYTPPKKDLMRRFLHINFANAYVLNGMTYLNSSMRQEARDVLSFAAQFYYHQGETEKNEITAIRSNLEQIVVDPNIGVLTQSKSAAYFLDLTTNYIASNNLSKAIKTTQAATIVEPQNVDARLLLAYLYEKGGDAPFSIKEYENTLMLDPENASASSALSRLTQVSSPL